MLGCSLLTLLSARPAGALSLKMGLLWGHSAPPSHPGSTSWPLLEQVLGGDLPLGFADNENNVVIGPHGFQNLTINGAAFIDIYSIQSPEQPGEAGSQEEETGVQRSEMTYADAHA